MKTNKLKYFLNVISMVLCLFAWQEAIAAPPCPKTNISDEAQWAGGKRNLLGHFLKHRGEDSSWTSPSAYTHSATAALTSSDRHTLRSGPHVGRKIFWKADSSNSNTGVFVVTDKDKKIISAFRPSSGKSYYNKQVNKDNGNVRVTSINYSVFYLVGDNDRDIWTVYTTVKCKSY